MLAIQDENGLLAVDESRQGSVHFFDRRPLELQLNVGRLGGQLSRM